METYQENGSQDPVLPFFFFYQETEKGKWIPALASERGNIIRTKKPALVSALDVDNNFNDDLTLDEIRGLRYSGALFFDWDSVSIEEATTHFQEFLTNLKTKGINLDMLRLYATGKKGFHCEIHTQVFMAEMPPAGVHNLPDIYREMAHSLYVPTLDLRIYSAKRGRMWRCPNVHRDNGKYKVQITADEARSMTPDLYDRLCSSPRNSLPIEAPVLNAELALLYAKCMDKVKGRSKRVHAASAESKAFTERFGSKLPPSLAALGQGRFPARRGWNELAMQWCLSAIAVGMTEDAAVDACKGLIQSHISDGNRYNSPSKREDAIRTMYRYLDGNSGYSVSVAGIRSILPQGLRCTDFRGL